MEKNVTEFIIDDMEQSNTIEELKSYYIDVSNWFVGNVMLGVDKDELCEYYDISVKYQFNYLDDFLKRNYFLDIDDTNYGMSEQIDDYIRFKILNN